MTVNVRFKVGDHIRWNSEAEHVNSLLGLLVLSLAMPALIFGARAIDLSIHGDSASGPLLLLTAMFVLALTMTPPAVVAALRISAK